MSTRRFVRTAASTLPVVLGLPLAAAQQTLFDVDGPANSAYSFGRALANAGDVDGDGLSDLVVGSPSEPYPSPTQGAGAIRVFSGANGALLLQATGPAIIAGLGAAVAAAGDLDGDGKGDVLTKTWDSGIEQVRAYSGANGSVIRSFPAPAGTWSYYYAADIAQAQDLNGDQVPDVIVSAAINASDTAWAFSGANGALLFDFGAPGLGSPQPQNKPQVESLGDLDGDGVGEVALGSPMANGSHGVVRIHSGATGGLIRQIAGVHAVDLVFGFRLAAVGDVDGDGLDDLAVGYLSGGCGSGMGKIDVVSGGTGALLYTWTGFGTSGCAQAADHFGWAIAGAGDVDGDAVPDVVAGAELLDVGFSDVGGAFVYSGRTGGMLSFVLPFTGSAGATQTGTTVAGLGDVDGDARGDFAVASAQYVVPGVSVGRVRVHSGAPDAITSYGAGCAGTGGFVPSLAASFVAPSSIQVQIAGGYGGTPALLLLGLLPKAQPLYPSQCTLLVDPLALTLPGGPLAGSGPGAGTLTIVAALPPAAQGTFALQALVSAPTGVVGHFAATNGLQISIH